MSRYRSCSMPATTAPHRSSIQAAIHDFLLYHERKGDSASYLQELRSYLIGGSGKYGTRRPWKPLQPCVSEHQFHIVSDLTKNVLGSYLDEIRFLAARVGLPDLIPRNDRSRRLKVPQIGALQVNAAA